MKKIDIDKRADLYELINSEGYKVLLEIVNDLKNRAGTNVLQYRLIASADGIQELAARKAAYEGADKLIGDLLTRIADFKQTYEEAERINRG